MEIYDLLPFGIILILVGMVYLFGIKKTKEEKEFEAAQKKRLEDEFYYDPESGQKLTLEELETGEIIVDEQQLNRVKTEEELIQNFLEEDLEMERLLNQLKKAGFQYMDFTDSELDTLGQTILLSSYDHWSYSRPYYHSGMQIRLCFVQVENYYTSGKNSGSYSFNQLFYWVQNKQLSGHYFFKEKTMLNKFTGLLSGHRELKINGFVGTILVQSNKEETGLKYLSELLQLQDVDFEQKAENIFVKTQSLPTFEACATHFMALDNAIKQSPYSRTQI